MVITFRRAAIMVGGALVAGCGGGVSETGTAEPIGTVEQAVTGVPVCLPPSVITRIAPSQGLDKFAISRPSISADGRFVAFDSAADNIVPGDTNGVVDVFVLDRLIGQFERVSVKSDGSQVFNQFGSSHPKITPDGRYVVFNSDSTFLAGQGARTYVFRHDRLTHATIFVSSLPNGSLPAGSCLSPSVSADGSIVAFDSASSDLVPGDTNGGVDVFARDLTTGVTTRISVASDGSQVGDDLLGSISPAVNGNGRLVAFLSRAPGLVPGDTNNAGDVFVHDRVTHQTTRVSVSSTGEQSNGGAGDPDINDDGRLVVFPALATNLAPGLTEVHSQLFLHDRTTGTTTLVSVSNAGPPGSPNPNPTGLDFLSGSAFGSMTPDGRLVAFGSSSVGLVPNDTNTIPDIFLRNRQLATTTRLSVTASGAQGTGSGALGQIDGSLGILGPSLSADGITVVFGSIATNLVPGDTNGVVDLFVRDLRPVAPPWATGQSYLLKDVVTFGGKVYECRQAHTSVAGWEPTQTPALWQLPTPCGVTPWAVQTAYMVDSRVTFQGGLYRCISAHTADGPAWDPVHTPALWQHL